jgi:hypothetical protein
MIAQQFRGEHEAIIIRLWSDSAATLQQLEDVLTVIAELFQSDFKANLKLFPSLLAVIAW